MKHIITSGIVILLLLLSGCKEKDIPLSGVSTIDNDLFGSGPYYSYGFSFALAKMISTLHDPEPDFTVEAGIIGEGSIAEPYLSANTLEPSFALAGEYATVNEANTAFEALTAVGTQTWMDLGYPLKDNQVWIIRTGDSKYAKIRTITVLITPGDFIPFASCKFEWVFQPDGTQTFPAP